MTTVNAHTMAFHGVGDFIHDCFAGSLNAKGVEDVNDVVGSGSGTINTYFETEKLIYKERNISMKVHIKDANFIRRHNLVTKKIVNMTIQTQLKSLQNICHHHHGQLLKLVTIVNKDFTTTSLT